MSDQELLSLSVTIPAGELAGLKRRVQYLEAALIQVLRDGQRIKEWFSAAELADLRLPGLPASRAAITRQARAEGWLMHRVRCQGGERHVYHFSSLPRRPFQALLDLVLKNPPPAPESDDLVPTLPPPAPVVTGPDPGNTAPPWVLPLMRILRAGAGVDEALQKLPAHLPPGTGCPSRLEALEVLKGLGLTG